MEITPTKNVYQLIASVAAEVAQEGISKSRKNQQQGYQFRGIDDVYNALAPILAKHGLVILPRCISRSVAERQARGGGVLFSVVVEAEFDFVSSFDWSVFAPRSPPICTMRLGRASHRSPFSLKWPFARRRVEARRLIRHAISICAGLPRSLVPRSTRWRRSSGWSIHIVTH